jgi:enamine deaminase RidA (YjgF/YER057c/UK114 family)
MEIPLRLKIFPWLGDDFVSLSTEGSGEGTVEEEVRQVFERFEQRLDGLGLGLHDVVRTRMFTRDMDTWLRANQERRRILDGASRSVSSSHICTERLGERARVTLDLLALFPRTGRRPLRVRREYDPPQFPLRSMTVGAWVFLSGVTDMTHVTLEEQLVTIMERIHATLRGADVDWKDVVKVSFLLHEDENLDAVRAWFRQAAPDVAAEVSWTFVGSRQGKRIEVEVTAQRR